MKMGQRKIVIGNWKMNPGSAREARALAVSVESGLLSLPRGETDVVLCPPAVFLPVLQHSIHFAKLGAQNMAAVERGAFTGEVSAVQLQQFRAEYVILGHSERRAMGETEAVVNQKLKLALKHKIQPVVCVGFGTKKSFTSAAMKRAIKQQLQNVLAGVPWRKTGLIVAYEPVWAISQGLGTGSAERPAHAGQIAAFIADTVPGARVIYGGSVDGKNASVFAAQKDLCGALVGGASLVGSEFLKIIKSFSHG